MNITPHLSSGVPDEGLLVRHLHGELEPEAERALVAHLDRCDACRRASSALQARERRIGCLLRETAPPTPHPAEWWVVEDKLRKGSARRRLVSNWLIAASVSFALLAAGLATPPGWAWVAEHWPRTFEPSADPQPNASAPGHADLRFPVDGSTLQVVMMTRPEGGLLTLLWTDGTVAELSVIGGGSERLEVGTNLVRIHDTPSSSASYELSVPARVNRVSVLIRGVTALEFDRPTGVASPIVIDLSNP